MATSGGAGVSGVASMRPCVKSSGGAIWSNSGLGLVTNVTLNRPPSKSAESESLSATDAFASRSCGAAFSRLS